jgi:prepilin-type N-terminal cleavage/methylation domain-containing protein
MIRRRAGFTLLEVTIAMAIMALQLFVLMSVQSTAGLQTYVADRYGTATFLAREKATEVRLLLEREGFGDSDLEENGDFQDFGLEDDDLDDYADSFEEYRWAYTVREVSLGLAGDMASMAGDLAGSGYWGDEAESGDANTGDTPGLSDLGVDGDMIGEMLSPYFRELRVRVWWTDIEIDGFDPVEFVTHVINPSGQVVPGAGATGLTGEGSAAVGGDDS